MFKRLRWMGMGAVAGAGASAWARRRLRRTLEEHPSVRAGGDLVSGARRIGREVGAAPADGRRAMAEREAALRADLDAARQGGGGPGDLSDGRQLGGPPGLHPRLRIVDATSHPPGVGIRPEGVAGADGRSPGGGGGAGGGGARRRAVRRRPGA